MASLASMASVSALSGAISSSASRVSRFGDVVSSPSSAAVMRLGKSMPISRRAGMAIRAQAAETETSAETAINPGIRKEEAKVVDTVLVGELDKPLAAYCRCWRSQKFPLCDGAHAKFNQATGDNVGPLLVKK